MLPVPPNLQTAQAIVLPPEMPEPPVAGPQEETVAALSIEELSDNALLDRLSHPHFPWPADCPRDACMRIAQMVPRNLPEQNSVVLEWLQECAKRNHPGLTEHEQIMLAAQLFLRYKFGILDGSFMGINLQEVCKKAKDEGEDRAERLLFTLISTPCVDRDTLSYILKVICTIVTPQPIQQFIIAFKFLMMKHPLRCEDLSNITHIVSNLSCTLNGLLNHFEDMLQYHPLSFLAIWPRLSVTQQEKVSKTLRSFLQSNLPYLIDHLREFNDRLPPEVITKDDIFAAVLERIKGQSDNTDILKLYNKFCFFKDPKVIYESLKPHDIVNILYLHADQLLDVKKTLPILMKMSDKDLSALLSNLIYSLSSVEEMYDLLAILYEKRFTVHIPPNELAMLLGKTFHELKKKKQLHWILDFIEPITNKDCVALALSRCPVKRDILSALLNGDEETRNRCLDYRLWRIDPKLVREKCDEKTYWKHVSESFDTTYMPPEEKQRWFSALLKKDCCPEIILSLRGEQREILITHLLANNPERLADLLPKLSSEEQQHIASCLIEKHPLLTPGITDYLSKQQKDLAVKNMTKVDPQAAATYIQDHILQCKPLKDRSKKTASIYCALYLHICPLQSPDLIIALMERCTAYLNTQGVPDAFALQADHRKLFQILLDGLDPCITKEDKDRLIYLLAERTFKDYKNNREQIWKVLLLLGDASLSVKEKRKTLHYLAGENRIDSRSTEAQQLLQRANTLLILNVIPNGLAQWAQADLVLAHFMRTLMPSMTENFLEDYLKTFCTWQDPYALIQYVSQLHRNLVPSTEKDQLLQCCGQFIRAVFDGPEKWRELRGARTAHMEEVERLSSPSLLERWSQEVSLPMSELIAYPEGGPSVVDLKKIFHTALIADGHLPHIETRFPHLYAILTEGPQPTLSSPEPLEDLLIESISHPHSEILKKIAQAMQKVPEIASSQFARDIHDLIQQLDTDTVKATCALQVVETDDPEILFLVPTLISGSCQSVYAETNTNKCLMGHVLDPKNRMIVVKTPHGKPVARGILRILLASDASTQLGPALFLERLYPPVLDPQIKEAIIAMAKHKARILGIPLHVNHQTLPPQTAPSKGKLLLSIDSVAPFEYCDSAITSLASAPSLINRGSYQVLQNEIDTTPGERVPAYGPA